MTFWDDASSDLSLILDDTSGSAVSVTHTPHAGGATSSVRVILVVQVQSEDARTERVKATAYFSKQDLSAPQYQDTFTDPDGAVWKLIRSAGSNRDLLRWDVERDQRYKL